MALAGHDHIVIPVKTQLGGTAGQPRRERGNAGEPRALRFLAAKPAAHTPHFHRYRVIGQVEEFRNIMLHFRWMLGGGMEKNVAVFPRQREGDLPFQIKMILPADCKMLFQPVLRLANGLCGIAAAHFPARQDKAFGGKRLFYRGDGGEFLILNDGQLCGGAGLRKAVGGDGEKRLARIFDDIFRKDGIIPGNGGGVILPRHIAGGQHSNDARRGADGIEIHSDDAGVGLLTLGDVEMQKVFRLCDIVNIKCVAGRLSGSAVMGAGAMNRSANGCLAERRVTHGQSLSRRQCGWRCRSLSFQSGICAADFLPPTGDIPGSPACRSRGHSPPPSG